MRRIAPLVALALAGCVSAPQVARTPAAPPPLAAPAAVTPSISRSAALAAAAATATNPMVGGAAMLGTRSIAENCASAPNLSTLARAMEAGGVRATLAESGPVTVFAPTDAAFGRLAGGAVQQLLDPANRPALVKVLRYHVVPGAITLDDLRARVRHAGGRLQLTTVAGEPLVASSDGAALALTDANGNTSYVETPDVQQRDGIVHVVNGVLVPRLG